MKKRKKKRLVFAAWLLGSCLLLSLGVYGYAEVRNDIPDEIKVIEGDTGNVYFNPFVKTEILDEGKEVANNAFHKEEYEISCKLFGVLPVKNVHAEVVDKAFLIPGGIPIGIYLETDGILVIGTGAVEGIDGITYDPSHDLVQAGDYILAVNGERIHSKKELIQLVEEEGQDPVVLDLRRNEDKLQVKVNPVLSEPEEYKLGIWVRDNTQGIGTLTFLSGDGHFGALGHGINDVDTSSLMELKSGTLYNTEILKIKKGAKGTPGELSGVIEYKQANVYGSITDNTAAGIFGQGNDKLKQALQAEPVEVCYKQDIQKGKAVIRSFVSGELKDYEVEIVDINNHGTDVNKGIVLKVTDEELLSMTGGIVQGMSGSPILQNGKIIGAVTHVFVQDSTKGFGIFIENMLEY